MGSLFTLATVFASLCLHGVHAATIVARIAATTNTLTRPRRNRIARGIIAAIVIPSIIGLGLLVLCCVCAARMFSRRRNTQGTSNPDAYAPPGLPVAPSGTYGGPGTGYPNGGGAAYGLPPGAPQQAYYPGAKNEQFIGGFADPGYQPRPQYY